MIGSTGLLALMVTLTAVSNAAFLVVCGILLQLGNVSSAKLKL